MTLLSCRVLDLTDEKGFLCGKILADLGAEVIKVEKPGGDPSRNIEPFYHGIPDKLKSLYWFAFNSNKKGITLDIETDTGKSLFRKLIGKSDIVIESFAPGYMDSIGLGYSSLCEINSSIVMTSLTPFGQHGPYKNYKASDLTLLAMAGLLYITGYPDRPPVRISFPQSWLLAGSSAAASTLIAYHHAVNAGKGQHVDVNIQASITWNITNTIPLWELNEINLERKGSVLSSRFGTGANQRILWKCKDGYVAYIVFGGRLGISMGNLQLTSWIIDEGLADNYLKQFNWEIYDLAIATQETQSKLESYVDKLFLKYSKIELYQEGLKRNIKIFPVYSPEDMMKDPQLEFRNFWVQVEHPELNNTLVYPGYFYKTSTSELNTMSKPPLIGEHNDEVYANLGITTDEIIKLKHAKII